MSPPNQCIEQISNGVWCDGEFTITVNGHLQIEQEIVSRRDGNVTNWGAAVIYEGSREEANAVLQEAEVYESIDAP